MTAIRPCMTLQTIQPLDARHTCVLHWTAHDRARRMMSTVAPERVNVSRLLDRNLDAGRADKPAIVGEQGTLTYGDVARLTARTVSLLGELGVAREHRVVM